MNEFIEFKNIIIEMNGEILRDNIEKIFSNIKISKEVLLECWPILKEEKRVLIIEEIGKFEKFDLIMFINELISDENESKMIKTMFSVWRKYPFSTMLEPLEEYLKFPDNRIRADAVEIIELIDDDKVIDILTKLLNDKDNRVRANAAKALWLKGSESGFKILKRMLRSSNIWMRSSASYAISCIDAEKFLDVLISAINDEFPSVREKIIYSLSKVNNEKSYENLFKVLKDSEEIGFIRRNVYKYLRNCPNIKWQKKVKKYALKNLPELVIDDIKEDKNEKLQETKPENREEKE